MTRCLYVASYGKVAFNPSFRIANRWGASGKQEEEKQEKGERENQDTLPEVSVGSAE
jgi:hypothetical protein